LDELWNAIKYIVCNAFSGVSRPNFRIVFASAQRQKRLKKAVLRSDSVGVVPARSLTTEPSIRERFSPSFRARTHLITLKSSIPGSAYVPGHFYIGSTDNLRQRLRQNQAAVDAYAARQPVAAARDRVVDSMVGKSFLRDRVVGHE
jgi:hypothetical protein